MLPALDLLAIGSKQWKIKQTIKGFPQGFALGLFADETFGPLAIKNTTKLLKTGKVSAVRAHLNWAGPNPSHALPPLSKIKKLAPKWEELAKQFPSIKFYISPSCEAKSNDKAKIKELLDLTASLCPSCFIVWSPMQSPSIPGYITEVHGKKIAKEGMIASYDGGTKGEALWDTDAQTWVKKNANAILCFSWAPIFNMAESHNTLPPNKRTASPSAKVITAAARLFDIVPPAPIPDFADKVIKPIKKPLLLKNFAEDMQGKNSRDDKPLLMLKKQTSSIEVVTCKGQSLGKFVYFAPYPPDLFRFYAGLPGGINLYGYQISDKAKALSGSEWVWFKQENTYYGPVCCTFRWGFFK